MRWTRWTALASSLGAATLAALTFSCAATQQNKPAAMTQEQKIARGEYLSHVCGCVDCHTPGFFYNDPDWKRNLSGSELGWEGPWGTSYARNLTPDPETGIASWSEDDIVKTFRTGQRADGSKVLPPMPWPSFSTMTDEDAYCLAAYLKSLPPVKHKVPDRQPPGAKVAGSIIHWPPPSAWDAPRTPPGGAPSDTTKKAG
jgi:mono/diheme cytochrome c family protein